MGTDERVNDLFRKVLSLVRPSDQPTMDWTAMARLAKTGAADQTKPSAPKRVALWLKLLGGTAVILGIWYWLYRWRPGPVPAKAP
jgi:hypothetical protein